MIVAHGVIATIVFLGFVPAAIMIVRYYSFYDRYWAYKYHVWLQVLTLLLSTVVFVLGWFAVGPQRSLTNPHHGIGLALYVMVIFQALWGWFSRKIERGRRHYRSPLILVVWYPEYKHSTLRVANLLLATPLDRMGYGTSRPCSDSSRTDSIRFSKISVHPIRPGGFLLACSISHLLLHIRRRWRVLWSRYRWSRKLYFRTTS